MTRTFFSSRRSILRAPALSAIGLLGGCGGASNLASEVSLSSGSAARVVVEGASPLVFLHNRGPGNVTVTFDVWEDDSLDRTGVLGTWTTGGTMPGGGTILLEAEPDRPSELTVEAAEAASLAVEEVNTPTPETE